jgi:hypothetical protein
MRTCSCGAEYWPAQKWIHKECSVNHQEPVANVVVNERSKDRHKKTPERAKYMAEYMRKRRA